MEPIISVNGLTKTFDNLTAVDNLSFTVNEGDVYGFLGQNGAGKSTTIRMMLTLIQPTAGSIRFFGKELSRERSEILKQVGAVIERPDHYKYLTAFENLSLFAKLSGVRRSREQLMAQLDQVGLADRAYSKVKTYSQGMKQRLGIAIALVHNPKLIVLDEPTNGLDPQGIADVRNLILHLSRHEKKTVVVSSHLLSEIEQIANRMLIIDRGKKMVEGSVSELFDPQQSVVEISTTDNEKALRVLEASAWATQLRPMKQDRIVVVVNHPDIHLLTAMLVREGVGVNGLQSRKSLEDYFLSLTSANQHVAAFTN
jgi:ABC-type multidrug transport system ATPase subunit